MKVKLKIFDKYTAETFILKIRRSIAKCHYSVETYGNVRRNLYNFSKLIEIFDSYTFLNRNRIEIIMCKDALYIIDKEYDFAIILFGDDIIEEKKLIKYWKNIYNNYVDSRGRWKKDFLIDGKYERRNIDEVEDEI